MSSLFWINALLGVTLCLVVTAMAPAIAAFYHETRLLKVTIALSIAFVFNGLGIQHSALLQREMRFTALAFIGVISLAISTSIGIGGAVSGYGYWALVAMTVVTPLIATIGCWVATGWMPRWPRTQAGVGSMIRFGSALTFTGTLVYIAYNIEKVLIGRFWGTDAIGIYGRAYQLISIPNDNLNMAVGELAFSALARVQDDRIRLRRYFLTGLSIILSITFPITIAVAFFADDVVIVFLGPKWEAATAIVRLLAPTIVIFSIINPLGWLIFSMGLVARGLRAAPILAALMIAGYVIGLPYGPKGIALAYSTVSTLWVIPHIWWCLHGTVISVSDILRAMSRPFISGIFAGGVALAAHLIYGPALSPLPRLFLETGILATTFFGMLLFAAGQKSLYLNLVKETLKRRTHAPT